MAKKNKQLDKFYAVALGTIFLNIFAKEIYEQAKQKLIGFFNWTGGLGIPGGQTPPESMNFPVRLDDPSPGEDWKRAGVHTIDSFITNPGDQEYQVYIGMSIKKPNGEFINFNVKWAKIKPGYSVPVSWSFAPVLHENGMYEVKVGVWRSNPSPGTPISELVGESPWIPFNIVWW